MHKHYVNIYKNFNSIRTKYIPKKYLPNNQSNLIHFKQLPNIFLKKLILNFVFLILNNINCLNIKFKKSKTQIKNNNYNRMNIFMITHIVWVNNYILIKFNIYRF